MAKRRYTDEQQAAARDQYNVLADELVEVYKVWRKAQRNGLRNGYGWYKEPQIPFQGEVWTPEILWQRKGWLQEKLGKLQGRYHLCTVLRKGWGNKYRMVRRAF